MSKIVCHDKGGNNYEVDENALKFRPSVYGVLIENGRVLLSKQWDGYDFPGGGIGQDETVEQALKREFWEETGLKVSPLEAVHCETSMFKPSMHDEFWNCQLIYFLVEKIGGELSKENLDHYEKQYADLPEWIELDKLSQIKFYNSVDSPAVIKKALRLL